jgi:hypothetical protein
MSEDHNGEPDSQQRTARVAVPTTHTGGDIGLLASNKQSLSLPARVGELPAGGGIASPPPVYRPSLLGDARLYGRGNAPVLQAVMLQAQQTYGNRAIQRFRQHTIATGGINSIRPTSVLSVQRRSHGASQSHLPPSSLVTIQQVHRGIANLVVQRWPGDGMAPPGDCSWPRYIVLSGSVGTAKALVSSLGACSPGESCIFQATKIAAITAEIGARIARDAACFRGGDAGHRQQVQEKVNMLNRCYRFFSGSNCPPELIAAMTVVVERARAVIAAAAVVVALALVVALIAAIIALLEIIAGLIAAAAAGAAAVTASIAAVMALLVLIRDQLSSGEPITG